MKTGLSKLVEAEKSVNELSKELVVKEKDLAVASKEADEVRVNFKILNFEIKVSLDKNDTEFINYQISRQGNFVLLLLLPWFGKQNNITASKLYDLLSTILGLDYAACKIVCAYELAHSQF